MDEKEAISEQIVSEEGTKFKNIVPSKIILNLLFILIILNLVFLDIIFLQGGFVKTIEKIVTAPANYQNNTQGETTCPQACIAKINELSASPNKPTTVQPTVSPLPTKQLYPQDNVSSVAKEYYVPFGTGSGASSDWQDVAGLQAYVDSTSYPNIKSVVFEASLHIPTGNENASVRLYNATDGHAVWNSELNFNGNTSSVFLTSQPVGLDTGNKLYKVQIKTQLQYTAVLDQSRLHIVTQ